MRLFISSTFRDLRPEREAVRDVLNRRARVTPWGMELFASSPEKPPKVCLEWLHMSDAVVLVTLTMRAEFWRKWRSTTVRSRRNTTSGWPTSLIDVAETRTRSIVLSPR